MANEVIAVQQRFHELCKVSFRDEFINEQNSTCLNFLKKRGLAIHQLLDENLDIGYCPPNIDYDVIGDFDDVKAAGLINENDEFIATEGRTSSKLMLAGRIIFTHRDGEDNIRYFSGRTLEKNVDAGLKYLGHAIHKEGSEYVDKHNVERLFWRDRRFNIADYRKDANELKTIVIVESILEAIALGFMFGDHYYVMATTCNWCSDTQLNALIEELETKKISYRNIIFFGDNDKGKVDSEGNPINPGFEGSKGSAGKFSDLYDEFAASENLVRQKSFELAIEVEKQRAKKAGEEPKDVPEPKPVVTPTIRVAVMRKPDDVISMDIGDHYQAGRIGELERALNNAENLWYWEQYAKGNPVRFFEGKKFNQFMPSRILAELEREGHYFLSVDKEMLHYEDGMYHEAEGNINRLIMKKLGKKWQPGYSESVRKAIKELTNVTYRFDNDLNQVVFIGQPDFDGSLKDNEIAVRNGILNLDLVMSKPYEALKPSNPYMYIPNTINAIYDPKLIFQIKDGTYLDWDLYTLFREIFVCSSECPKGCTETEDHDNKNLDLWFEACGYSLMRTSELKKFFIIHGASGNNGKSTATNILASTLGRANVSRVSLADMNDNRKQFALSSLYQKLANIAQEIGTGRISQTDRIKMLTGDDTIEIEKKGIDRFDYYPYATLIFAVNDLPNFADKSSPFLNRIAFIDCPNQFPINSEVSNKFKDPAEISKMLALCCFGYDNLMKRKGIFTEPENHKKLMEQFVLSNNPLAQFVADCIEYKYEDESKSKVVIETKLIRERFKNWASEEYPSMKAISSHQFNSHLRKALGCPADSKNIRGNKGFQGSKIYGAAWKTNAVRWDTKPKGQKAISDNDIPL